MKRSSFGRQRDRVCLLLLLALFSGFSIYYALVADLGGGPDETSHLIYIRTLATEHRLPEIATESVHDMQSTATHEGHQPPLYYALLALPYALLDALGLQVDHIWRVLRLLGIPLGVIWLLSVRRLGSLVFNSERAGLVLASFVALIPMASFMTGMVNNDIMISLWFGWGLVFIVRYTMDRALPRRTGLLLGAVIGAAILTKAQGLVLIPVFLLASAVVNLPARPGRVRQLANDLWPVFTGTALTAGWWVVWTLAVRGTIQADSLSNPLIPGGLQAVGGQWTDFSLIVYSVLVGTWGYFWTPFWIVSKFLGASVYLPLSTLATAAPVLGFALRALLVRGLDWRVYGVLCSAAVLLVAAWLRHALFVDIGANLQGRLFLPVAPVVGLLALAALAPVLVRASARRVGGSLFYVSAIALNLLVLRCVALYYTSGKW